MNVEENVEEQVENGVEAVLRKVALSNFDQKKPQLKTEVHSLPCEEGVSFPSCLFIGDLRRTEESASYLVIQHFNQCWITPGRDGCQTL